MCVCCKSSSSFFSCPHMTRKLPFSPPSPHLFRHSSDSHTGSQVNNTQQSWTDLVAAYPEAQVAPTVTLSLRSAPSSHFPTGDTSPSLPPRSSSGFQLPARTSLCLHCLHNTPVISMETSPGMAGRWRRSTSMWHTLSKQMDQSHPQLAEGTGGESKALGCLGGKKNGPVRKLISVFLDFSDTGAQHKSKVQDWRQANKEEGDPQNRSERGPVITSRLINHQRIHIRAKRSTHSSASDWHKSHSVWLTDWLIAYQAVRQTLGTRCLDDGDRGKQDNSVHCHERARQGEEEEVQVLNYLHSGSLKANRSKTPTPSFCLHASTQPGSPATHLQLALSRCTLQNRFWQCSHYFRRVEKKKSSTHTHTQTKLGSGLNVVCMFVCFQAGFNTQNKVEVCNLNVWESI